MQWLTIGVVIILHVIIGDYIVTKSSVLRKEDINKSDKLFMPKMSKNLRSLNENVSFDKLGRVLVEGNVFYLRGKRTEKTIKCVNLDCENGGCSGSNGNCKP